jgi:hypothetical protein
MRPCSAAAHLHDSLPERPRRDALTLELFAEAAAVGLTIALVVAKDAGAAAVYYFRDGLRAFESYERLCKLSAQPLVITLSPDGRVFGSSAPEVESTLKRFGLSWVPGFRAHSSKR